jgi:uncharacterized protein with HEPN domain
MRASAKERLTHLLEAIDDIEMLTDGRTLEEFRTNKIWRAAVERFLEIISEGSRHIPEEWKSHEPSIPWREIAAIGNVIRHGYDGIDFSRLWLVVIEDLPVLKAALLRLINIGET